jgi:hypothetical protein
MRLHGYCTSCNRFRLINVSGHGLAMTAVGRGPQGVCDECEETRLWPVGILSRVSREAFNAVTRARGFSFMTPAEREAAARSYDQLERRRTA